MEEYDKFVRKHCGELPAKDKIKSGFKTFGGMKKAIRHIYHDPSIAKDFGGSHHYRHSTQQVAEQLLLDETIPIRQVSVGLRPEDTTFRPIRTVGAITEPQLESRDEEVVNLLLAFQQQLDEKEGQPDIGRDELEMLRNRVAELEEEVERRRVGEMTLAQREMMEIEERDRAERRNTLLQIAAESPTIIQNYAVRNFAEISRQRPPEATRYTPSTISRVRGTTLANYLLDDIAIDLNSMYDEIVGGAPQTEVEEPTAPPRRDITETEPPPRRDITETEE